MVTMCLGHAGLCSPCLSVAEAACVSAKKPPKIRGKQGSQGVRSSSSPLADVTRQLLVKQRMHFGSC